MLFEFSHLTQIYNKMLQIILILAKGTLQNKIKPLNCIFVMFFLNVILISLGKLFPTLIIMLY